MDFPEPTFSLILLWHSQVKVCKRLEILNVGPHLSLNPVDYVCQVQTLRQGLQEHFIIQYSLHELVIGQFTWKADKQTHSAPVLQFKLV